MQQDYERLFRGLSKISPPETLYHRILMQLAREEKRAAALRTAFFGVTSLASFVVLIMAFQYTANELAQSDFYRYFSLLFSDGGILLRYWKEFTLTLVESLPLMWGTILLASIFALLGSFRLAIRNVRASLLSVQLIKV